VHPCGHQGIALPDNGLRSTRPEIPRQASDPVAKIKCNCALDQLKVGKVVVNRVPGAYYVRDKQNVDVELTQNRLN
jgi:hypothetical protein